MTHTSTEQPEASEQHLQELRSYRITVENREARIAELEAEIERLRKLHQDAYQRGFQAGSMGLREAYDAVQEVKHQDAWGNAQLTEALIAAEARIAELEAQLIAEAARTAEQKLRADQLEQQHDMQAKMHAQAAEQLAAAQQGVLLTNEQIESIEKQVWDLNHFDEIEREGNRKFAHLIAAATRAATQGLEKDVRAMVDLLNNREWAEHIGETALGRELEHAITSLYNHANPTTQGLERQKIDPLRQMLAQHQALLEQSPYAYFELAYTRQTGWMVWITDKLAFRQSEIVNPDRKVLWHGQGDTPDEACEKAAQAAQAKQGGEVNV